jgi:lipid II isoglutaminyl synthase (glutamine-hydrolysing)
MRLRLAHLYPKLMNIYGDRGNIIALRRRCEARGIDFEVTELELGNRFDPHAYEMAFIGGAQDVEQRRVAEDFRNVKGPDLRHAVENGLVLLAVCGGYQLAGRFYRGAAGDELPGAGIFDLHTVHPGTQAKRFIGNVVVEWDNTTLVGFENHGGRTYLGDNAKPLARIIAGNGNNGDGWEGAVYRNAFGTYLHGSLLPKNPRFADHLVALAVGLRNDIVSLDPLDDMVENEAHAEALRLATRRGIMLRRR